MEKQILKTDLGAGGLLKSIYLKMINDIKDMFIYIQQGHWINLNWAHKPPRQYRVCNSRK